MQERLNQCAFAFNWNSIAPSTLVFTCEAGFQFTVEGEGAFLSDNGIILNLKYEVLGPGHKRSPLHLALPQLEQRLPSQVQLEGACT